MTADPNKVNALQLVYTKPVPVYRGVDQATIEADFPAVEIGSEAFAILEETRGVFKASGWDWSGGGGGGTWGSITGTLSDQTDLQTALDAKENLSNKATDFSTVNNTLYPSIQAVKTYADTLSAGLKWKTSVKVATTVAGTLASSFENGDTVDGVTLVTGDRILIKNQASGSENGIYTVNASGAPTRATDADTGAELVSACAFVEQGTANADKAFICTNDAITLGVTTINFVAFLTVLGALIASNNLSDLTSAATARTNLGGTTVGINLFTATNPSAITYIRINADNSVTFLSASELREDLEVREVLTGNRTYYVRTDGSDSNDGLTNSSGGAFLTIQHAYDLIKATLDVAGYTVTIEVGDGTYAENLSFNNWVGNGSVIIDGNTGTPANVIIAPASGICMTFSGVFSGSTTIRGFKLTPTSNQALRGSHTGNIGFSSIVFTGVTGQYSCWLDSPGGRFTFTGTNELIGSVFGFARAAYGNFFQIEGGTFTLTSTPAFTAAFIVAVGAFARITPTYSGSSTGKAFILQEAYLEGAMAVGNAQGTMDDSSAWAQHTTPLFDVLTAQFDKTNDTLASITGFSVTLLAGRTYKGRAILYTASTVADGIKIDFAGGTATATSFIAEAKVFQGGALVAIGVSRSMALNTTIANVTAVTVGTIEVEFTIVVNAGGTFIPRFACNANAAGTSSVLINSTLELFDRTP